MRFTIFLFFIPLFGYPQSHLFKYYDEIKVINDGDTLKSPWSGGFNSVQINMADLDGDLQEEIILMDRNSASLSIFSFSNGEYVYRPELLQYLPDINIEWLILADYNCDGKKDIFNYGQSGVIVYKNTSGNGEYASWEKIADPLLTTGFSGKINLFVNPADVPSITDIDGDGDLDILCYNFATGEDIRFHKNMALENNGDCELFDFVIADRQWGQFKECSCFEYAFDGKTCSDVINGGRTTHIGGKSLTANDQDGDGDQDLFLGHDDCASLIYLENVGDNDSALFTDFSSQFPTNDPIEVELYPTVQFLDVDFDDMEEMVVSPNIDVNLSFTSDFSSSLWVYENEANGASPDYILIKQNFLQDRMLDFGEMSAPVFFDIDGDGDQDLLVAGNGKNLQDVFVGKIVWLENTGTSLNPVFSLTNDDFLNLSSLQLRVPRLRFADFNGDGRKDLFYAGYNPDELQVMSYVLYDNASGTASPEFSLDEGELLSIPLEMFENPEFFDEDNDGDQDLLIGMRDGSLVLYENTGNNSFELKQNEYYGIARDFSLEKINLFVEVHDLDGNGRDDLVTADRKEIAVYYDFLNSQREPEILKVFIDDTQQEISVETENYNWLALADLFGTGVNSLVLGGSGGGLKFFRNKNEIENPAGISATVKVYPNPVSVNSELVVETNKAGTVTLYNLWGQRVSVSLAVQAGVKNFIRLPQLAQGVYILMYENDSREKIVRKLVLR